MTVPRWNGAWFRDSPWSLALILALGTILIRFPAFGDPNYHIDEGFYLLVGQKMHEGLLPYIDIWDRKPAGLFLLYAAIAAFGDVLAYQLIAGIFACATAFVAAVIADRLAGRFAAIISGLLYLCLIGALAGGGGQSPVFYNLLVALAGFLVFEVVSGGASSKQGWSGYAAMILCGVAITIKPTAVVEGAFFGLTLMMVNWLHHRQLGGTITLGLRLALLGLLPTLLLWIWFGLAGAFGEYWFATMQSIFQTAAANDLVSYVRLRWLLTIVWLPIAIALAGIVLMLRDGDRRMRAPALFVTGWFVAALIGFLAVPNYYDHYALPVATIVAICAVKVFQRNTTGPVIGAIACLYLLYASGYPGSQLQRASQSTRAFTAVQELVASHIGSGCLYIYDAPPALYRDFEICSGTRYLFPEHLSNLREAGAIGADPAEELSQVLESRPTVIVRSSVPSVENPNLETRALLARRLRDQYAPVGRAELSDVVRPQEVEVWVRDQRQ